MGPYARQICDKSRLLRRTSASSAMIHRLLNTATVRSAVTFIDGDAGILRYRGYPIEQLAEKSTYLEVSYLLLNGELPDKAQLDRL